jgi:hypothetical protein
MADEFEDAGIVAPGEYAPPSEAQGESTRFTPGQVARAFGVDVSRVERAMLGELGLAAGTPVDSQQAQTLAEALLIDQPQAEREASLMQLGAFTPRRDHAWGIGEAAPGEESDRVVGDDDHVSQH